MHKMCSSHERIGEKKFCERKGKNGQQNVIAYEGVLTITGGCTGRVCWIEVRKEFITQVLAMLQCGDETALKRRIDK